MSQARTVYRFAEFTFDPDEARLLRGGRAIELQPKVRAALVLFLQRPGQLISKEELLERLWPDIHVGQDVLTQTIWKLRRALGDDPKEPRFIETVLKAGYRLLPSPEPPPPEPSAPAMAPPAVAPPARSAAEPPGPPPGAAQPPRAAYDPAWYVARPAEERTAQSYLAYAGTPVVLLGPEGLGKTWLLRHLLRTARATGRFRAAAISLDLLDQAACASLDSFLRALSLHLAAALGASPAEVDRAFARSPSPQANLNWLLEQTLLPPIADRGEHLILALDRADALAGRPFQDDFFGLLRAWAESGAEQTTWSHLRLVLAVSTTQLVRNPRQSPFNLAEPLRLGDLDEAQVRELAQLHGLRPAAEELARLRRLVGGHPHLVRLALFCACQERRPLGAVLEAGAPGPFAGLLSAWRARLQREPALLDGLRAVAGGGATGPELSLRLHRAGLIAWDPAAGADRLRYELYRELLG